MGGKKILNIGCGTETYGTHRLDFVNTGTTTEVFNIEKGLPYSNNKFDEIYSRSFLEHTRNVGILIDECYRVLKSGGKIWMRTDNASYLGFHFRNHQEYIMYQHKDGKDRHYFLFKEEHIRALFEKFKDIEITYTEPSKKLFFLPKKLKCMHVEVSAKK